MKTTILAAIVFCLFLGLVVIPHAHADYSFQPITIQSPYFKSNGFFYVIGSGLLATKPPASPSWINSVAPSTITNGPNGDLLVYGASNTFQTQTATASVEAEMSCVNMVASGSAGFVYPCGVWLWDSTNGHIWNWHIGLSSNSDTAGSTALILDEYTYSGSGNPVNAATPAIYNYPGGSAPIHLKIAVVGGTLSLYASLNGGQALFPFGQTESVGTISKGGFFAGYSAVDVYSLVVK